MGSIETYRHRLISTAGLGLTVSTFPLGNSLCWRESGRVERRERRTCLQRPHWNASVSASCSPAPRVLNRFSSAILAFSALRSSDAISLWLYEHGKRDPFMTLTWMLIRQNLATARSPETTLERRPGLFLSFKLTKSERIFVLYAWLVPPMSFRTVFSISFARERTSSLAVDVGE